MIGDYFEFIKRIANKNPDVTCFRLIRECVGVNSGFIRFVLELRDGCELHVFEFIDSNMHKIDYSYHWLDSEKNMITRWDNAPHHKNIPPFPHHVHEKDGIKPSVESSLAEILHIIGKRKN